MRRNILALLSLICLMTFSIPTHAEDKKTIRFKVTKHGLVTNDITMTDKRFSVPKGVRLRVIFEYGDTHGNAHQFSIQSTKTELTAKRLAPDAAATASLEFTVGDGGEDFYRMSCDLPCIAMEALSDYILFVGGTART